jgi:hypothetical protein
MDPSDAADVAARDANLAQRAIQCDGRYRIEIASWWISAKEQSPIYWLEHIKVPPDTIFLGAKRHA